LRVLAALRYAHGIADFRSPAAPAPETVSILRRKTPSSFLPGVL
jgi:hypothetical protein